MAISVGVTLAVATVLILIIFYLNKSIVAASETINGMRADFLSRSKALASLADLKNDAEQARIYSYILNSSLPTKEDLPSFNTEVFNLEKKNNLPSSFKFSGAEVAPRAGASGEIAFDLNLDGAYNDLVDFLKDFEDSSYVTDIRSFDLVGGGGIDKYRALFRGVVFFR
jgi:Tfp pilus assembly protein PilO